MPSAGDLVELTDQSGKMMCRVMIDTVGTHGNAVSAIVSGLIENSANRVEIAIRDNYADKFQPVKVIVDSPVIGTVAHTVLVDFSKCPIVG
tara:strand:+ start:207 stop:479 length:273 start_codon:yes stop_codon:yes gene_type:complete